MLVYSNLHGDKMFSKCFILILLKLHIKLNVQSPIQEGVCVCVCAAVSKMAATCAHASGVALCGEVCVYGVLNIYMHVDRYLYIHLPSPSSYIYIYRYTCACRCLGRQETFVLSPEERNIRVVFATAQEFITN